jgi:tRNA(Ile)-lysidine synthetase-like protein
MSTTKKTDCRSILRNFLEQSDIPIGSRVLVGLSGGPDSSALFYLLKEVSPDFGVELFGLYIDHGIRSKPERRRELERIRKIEEQADITVLRRFCTPGVIEHAAEISGCGLEAAARRYRYKIFDRVLHRFGFDYLFLGHTLDDQIETMTMRFFQGSGPEGLKGIPRQRGKILRPLLNTRKQEIFEYLEERGIEYITDSTNDNIDFLRNRVRGELLPAAESIFPGAASTLPEMAGKYGEIADFIRSEAKKKLPLRKCTGGWGISIDAFRAAHPAMQAQAVYNMANALVNEKNESAEPSAVRGTGPRLPYKFVREIRSIALGKGHEGPVHSGYDLQFVIEEGALQVIPYVVNPEKKGYLLTVKDVFEGSIHRSGFQIAKSLISSSVKTNNWIYEHEGLYPLIIRSWRYGDRIEIKGGTKEVRKLFQEWNVPDSMKWDIPIVESPCGIEAVFGGFFGFPNRIAVQPDAPRKQKKEKVLVFSYTDNKDGIFE